MNYHQSYHHQAPPQPSMYGQYQQPQQQVHPILQALNHTVAKREWGENFKSWMYQSNRIQQCYREFDALVSFLNADPNEDPVASAGAVSVLAAYIEWLQTIGAQHRIPETILTYPQQQKILNTYQHFLNPEQQSYGSGYQRPGQYTNGYGVPSGGVNNLGFTNTSPAQPSRANENSNVWGSASSNQAIQGVTGGGNGYTVSYDNNPSLNKPVQRSTSQFADYRQPNNLPEIRQAAVKSHIKRMSDLCNSGTSLYIPGYTTVTVANEQGEIEQLLVPEGGDVDSNLHLGLNPSTVLNEKVTRYVAEKKQTYLSVDPVTYQETEKPFTQITPEFSLTDQYGDEDMYAVDQLVLEYVRTEIDGKLGGEVSDFTETVQGAAIQMQLDYPERYTRSDAKNFVINTWDIGHELPAGILTEKNIQSLEFVNSINDAVKFIQRLPEGRTTRWLDRQLTEDFNLYASLRAGLSPDNNIVSIRDLPANFDVEGAVGKQIDPKRAGQIPYQEELNRITRAWADSIHFSPARDDKPDLISYKRHVAVALVGLQFKDLPLGFHNFPDGRMVYVPGVLGAMDGYIIRSIQNDGVEFVYVVTEDDVTLEYSYYGGPANTVAELLFVRIVNRTTETEYISQLYQSNKSLSFQHMG